MRQPQGVQSSQSSTIKFKNFNQSSAMGVGSLGRVGRCCWVGSILHKTGYNYGIDGASKYYNPFYVTYRGKGSKGNTEEA
ncbi:hypothetical protein KIM67_18460 [Flagellimonas sp. 389]|uniref:hypothetical protein n=1 Tax=Flagellimonas sp. 389 TaxID=2835862 RepID=UPI001BD6152D|nr:hypothetical protein [Flagellimonas sp. 389]MBS9464406.1 hypothetical protein [Flagellimonas sp. 389]